MLASVSPLGFIRDWSVRMVAQGRGSMAGEEAVMDDWRRVEMGEECGRLPETLGMNTPQHLHMPILYSCLRLHPAWKVDEKVRGMQGNEAEAQTQGWGVAERRGRRHGQGWEGGGRMGERIEVQADTEDVKGREI